MLQAVTTLNMGVATACRSGESERNLKAVFEVARVLQPTLIFIVS